ncbi:hypothetical protein ACRRTK_022594 [Alexandromys fortis]
MGKRRSKSDHVGLPETASNSCCVSRTAVTGCLELPSSTTAPRLCRVLLPGPSLSQLLT